MRELYQAYGAAFLGYLRIDEMGERVRRWTERWGRLGVAARGIVFGVVGAFLIRAALGYDPREAWGLGERCRRLPGNPWDHGCWAPWRSVWSPTGCSCSRWRATGT